MPNKKIYKFNEIKDKIFEAVDIISNPIKQTMGPLGGNVLYEDDNGNQFVSNDGVTIAKNIIVENDVQNAIIETIKHSALKTNSEAGDGTSSTILLSSILIKEGLKLVEDGYNQMDVKMNLEKFSSDIKRVLVKNKIDVKNDDELFNIAKISANNDNEIASDVVKIIKVVGTDGQVIIDRGFSQTTEIIEDMGFVVRSGLLSEELGNRMMHSNSFDVPVLITDKRLYYKGEAETILKTVIENGYKDVVIVASDFIGEALPYFIANHRPGVLNIILVKETNMSILEDISVYLGGDVISDKKGSIVNNISIGDFCIAKRVFQDSIKTVISRNQDDGSGDINKRVKRLKSEMKKIGNKNDPEYKKIESRVSSLTNGMVTIKVGGNTMIEIMEKIFRYEDAINAVRAAIKDGYLPGGGIALYHAFNKIKVEPEYRKMLRSVTEANIRQVSENAGKTPEIILNEINALSEEFSSELIGFNARSGKFENMIDCGVIEPLLVATQSLENAVSIANAIITSRYFVVIDRESLKNKSNK